MIVRVGTRVTWTNHDTDPHTVKDVSGGWSSKALDTKGTYSHVFLKPGTYRYFCTIHPVMRGTVVVK